MSSRDYARFGDQLEKITGRKCYITLATNSIKLHIDENKKYGKYLWIDPHWELRKDGEIIESDQTYPNHNHVE